MWPGTQPRRGTKPLQAKKRKGEEPEAGNLGAVLGSVGITGAIFGGTVLLALALLLPRVIPRFSNIEQAAPRCARAQDGHRAQPGRRHGCAAAAPARQMSGTLALRPGQPLHLPAWLLQGGIVRWQEDISPAGTTP